MSADSPLLPPPADELVKLRELLAQHQELGRLQGNQLDAARLDLAHAQAKLRAAKWELECLRRPHNQRNPDVQAAVAAAIDKLRIDIRARHPELTALDI
jgi:hypothetical protein